MTDTVEQTAASIRAGTTARSVTEGALARITECDGVLNAFSVVLREEALAEADARDQEQRSGGGSDRSTASRSRSRRSSTSPAA